MYLRCPCSSHRGVLLYVPLRPAPGSSWSLPGMETNPVLSPLYPGGDLWEERLDGLLDRQPRRGPRLGQAAGSPGTLPSLPAPLRQL